MNDSKILKKNRLFFAWQEEKENAWLRDMARQGWHLKSVGFLHYVFEKGAPADIVYQTDFLIPHKKDRREYLTIFSDAGWEHVGEFANWHYFRRPYREGGENEIYSDDASRMTKYRRLLLLLTIIAFPFWNTLMISSHRWSADASPLIIGIRIFQLFIFLLLIYALLRIFLLILRCHRRAKGKL